MAPSPKRATKRPLRGRNHTGPASAAATQASRWPRKAAAAKNGQAVARTAVAASRMKARDTWSASSERLARCAAHSVWTNASSATVPR